MNLEMYYCVPKLIFYGILCNYFLQVESIMFHLNPNSQKCLKEELRREELIVGEFEVSSAPDQKVDYVVKDSKQDILAQNNDITKGKFTFVTETQDVYEICFKSRVPSNMRGIPHEVSLITKRDAEAKRYETIGEANKLKPMEVELKKLEELSNSIVHDFERMRQREEEMRDTNESTNNRVLYLSVFSMGCLLGVSIWQVLYLRKFFISRKLIE